MWVIEYRPKRSKDDAGRWFLWGRYSTSRTANRVMARELDLALEGKCRGPWMLDADWRVREEQ